jgi:hypothetical protein
MVAAWACRNCRQVVSVFRFGAGGIRRALRTRRMVEAPARWPGLSSSPWMRWYPQLWFSVASRSMSVALGAHRWASGVVKVGPLLSGQAAMPSQNGAGVTSRRACSRLGSCRISAASTARSAQSSRGRRLLRRSTRSRAAAPAVPRSWTLMIGRAGPASCRAGRRPGRAGEETWVIILPDHPSPVVPVHRRSRLLEPDRIGSRLRIQALPVGAELVQDAGEVSCRHGHRMADSKGYLD